MKATTRVRAPGAFARDLPSDAKAWLPMLRTAPAWIVCPHMGPDADTLGSSLALARLIRALGGRAVVACADPTAARFDYLPGADEVWVNSLPDDMPADAGVICLDAADYERLGTMRALIGERRPLVNVDHHVSNRGWGSHNLIDLHAAATGEIVFLLFDHFGVPVDGASATCLWAALVTDTGSFRYPATTHRTLAIAAELLAAGVDAPGLGAAIYERRSPGSVRLLGLALSGLQLGAEGRLAWATVPLSMFAQAGATEEEADGIVEKLREVAGVEALFVARESADGTVRVSLRSKGAIDVNAVARRFGGGGHVQAAGCTIAQPLAEAEAALLAAMSDALG